uniref:Endonuclease/exonuclease/phosphatase domain-containing protein n=1 Tax=Quercus lobata TaxID=97700 RepID=A0A7N2RBF3_QUELO
MKRFFKPVEKEGSSKKPSLSQPEKEEDVSLSNESKGEPSKFMTWNANSFLLRVKNNWPEFTKLVTSFDRCHCNTAGLEGAPKNPGELKDDTGSSREEKQVREFCSCHKSHIGQAFNKPIPAPNRLLNTYAPNNGWKEEENSFPRRRKWDKRILEFVLQSSDKPLIWCGDLNVSHEEIDVSHPEFFSAAKQNGDCGQPGFTLAERRRFGTILKECVIRKSLLPSFCIEISVVKLSRASKWLFHETELIDAYRFLHKEKDMERGFSWSGNPIGKYRGKRMRIDYFIVSE